MSSPLALITASHHPVQTLACYLPATPRRFLKRPFMLEILTAAPKDFIPGPLAFQATIWSMTSSVLPPMEMPPHTGNLPKLSYCFYHFWYISLPRMPPDLPPVQEVHAERGLICKKKNKKKHWTPLTGCPPAVFCGPRQMFHFWIKVTGQLVPNDKQSCLETIKSLDEWNVINWKLMTDLHVMHELWKKTFLGFRKTLMKIFDPLQMLITLFMNFSSQ